jgi:fructose-bisphosphate aldolase class II
MVFKPGNVKLTKNLKKLSRFCSKKFNTGNNPLIVFTVVQDLLLKKLEEDKLGVIKMNIDTDLQFAFTEGIRDYMIKTLTTLKHRLVILSGADVPIKNTTIQGNGYEKVNNIQD